MNQRKVSTGDSLVQIYVPPSAVNSDDEEAKESGRDTDKKYKKYGRTLSADPEGAEGKRKVPPPLGDWCRSQSFPPPQKSVSGGDDEDLNKQSAKGGDKSVFGGRPLSKGVTSTASSTNSEHSDIEGTVQTLIFTIVYLTTALNVQVTFETSLPNDINGSNSSYY